MDWEAWEACLSLGRIVYFALGRFITDLSLPESIRVAGMIRAVPILFMKRCFNASFLDSFSLGYTGVSFTNGKEIMLSHNTLGQEHLKRQANRSLMETNNQHGRTKILIFLHTHTHTQTHTETYTPVLLNSSSQLSMTSLRICIKVKEKRLEKDVILLDYSTTAWMANPYKRQQTKTEKDRKIELYL